MNVEHLDRFYDEFGIEEEEDEKGNNQSSQDIHGTGKTKPQKSSKPRDFQILFGGNKDDDFMIGIKFTRYITFFYTNGPFVFFLVHCKKQLKILLYSGFI